MILKNNFYKQFGLLYIDKDKFLTLVGSNIPLAASVTLVSFGGCIDKGILSLQDCLVISVAANEVLCFVWFVAAQVNDIVYMLLILAIGCAHNITYTVRATGTIQLFGKDNFYILIGMVYSAASIGSILSAVIVSPFRQAFGWFGLFTSCRILSVAVLILTVFANFNTALTVTVT
ncbi:WD and tetratricopeptide repeats protein 1 [Plakobranchus ocellatus]|uniref:WD and tetratricopeptide repeats protein 1 n=1 Tax=Plakobranchus ocellatus TaxID=259542 RepID=A0AAV3Z520_9GAST|nr:WD and tetratricopeptide repeats protein 1 [Plakobranchus ocellatus]